MKQKYQVFEQQATFHFVQETFSDWNLLEHTSTTVAFQQIQMYVTEQENASVCKCHILILPG